MLSAFVLHKEWALLSAEFLQVPAGRAPRRVGGSRVQSLASQQEVNQLIPKGPALGGLVPRVCQKRARARASPQHQDPS